ncbi:late embryogenesis abundant protein [Pseudomonas duriflava]|uniref:Late embryogenesis abundant protein n=1 Tax=Pseudomonas duriflava TaxID=459528 RepID=A0A562QKY0_9PSED|nr:LEA type 2 family protein [Pseudomonas duriflava]TWI57369.1 late embryogenesis abundant protein [Pseudomonas duriflava]
MPSFAYRQCFRLLFAALLALGLAACSTLGQRDPLRIGVAGIEPLPGQGLEARFAVKLRVQNPNDTPIDYNGIAMDLEVNGQPLASGVSDQRGTLARYSEAVITVPLTVSAFSAVRQFWGLTENTPAQKMPYVIKGKLAGGLFGTVRFKESGQLSWPEVTGITP